MITAKEVRAEFNRQQSGATPGWVRLNLADGPVLARRNMEHHSAQIYLLVVSGTGPHKMARHYIVTEERELKTMGANAIVGKDLAQWVELIGLTRLEYESARRAPSKQQAVAIDKYEHGITPANRS